MLLSYDQSVFVDDGLLSLTYWTIVGAYVVPGEKNDTQTLIDAAVYDIASRKLLFRAPGASVIKSRSTLIANPEQLREDSTQGFADASMELTSNLSVELERFQQRLRIHPQSSGSVHVKVTPVSAVAASMCWFLFMLAGLFGVAFLLRRLQKGM